MIRIHEVMYESGHRVLTNPYVPIESVVKLRYMRQSSDGGYLDLLNFAFTVVLKASGKGAPPLNLMSTLFTVLHVN